MSNYTRVSKSAQATAAQQVQIRSTSNYAGETREAFNAGILSSDFPNLQKGVEFNPRQINLDMHRRFIWIGACAPREDGDASWYFIGRFVLFLGSAVMLEIPIRAGGYLAPGFGSCARRYSSGGQQPAINFRYIGSDTYSKDVPCMTFTVRANRAALIPDDLNLPYTGNCYVFGYQIISQNETL